MLDKQTSEGSDLTNGFNQKVVIGLILAVFMLGVIVGTAITIYIS